MHSSASAVALIHAEAEAVDKHTGFHIHNLTPRATETKGKNKPYPL